MKLSPIFYVAVLMIATFLSACGPSIDSGGHPLIVIETEAGDIYAAIYNDKAPVSGNRFLQNVRNDFYTDAAFYRVLSDNNQPTGVPQSNLIQGGVWKKPGMEEKKQKIMHEHTGITGLTHLDGSLSFARQDTGTASSEFFICLGSQPGFDLGGSNNPDGMGYAAFGRVVKGMSVVKSIYARPQEGQYFVPPVKIKRIRILKN